MLPRPAAANERPTSYMQQLDGLRCFAVLVVIYQHTGAGGPLTRLGEHGIGVYGVWLFFVLSGFLITGILLRARDAVRDRAQTTSGALSTFYARRALRILPAYYLLLGIMALLQLSPRIRADLPWHAAYLSNWLIAWRGAWSQGTLHFWSLSVEEQFYLFWPLVILTVPARLLPRVIGAMIAVGVLTRTVLVGAGVPGPSLLTPTPASLDSLGLGALLAWHCHTHPTSTGIRRRAIARAGVAGLALVLVTVGLTIWRPHSRILGPTEPLGASLVAVWLVGGASVGFLGPGRVLLENAVVQYLGRISYGIYLYHEVLAWGIHHWAPIQGSITAAFSGYGPRYFVLITCLTVGVASVSWFCFERPINRLKRAFAYAKA